MNFEPRHYEQIEEFIELMADDARKGIKPEETQKRIRKLTGQNEGNEVLISQAYEKFQSKTKAIHKMAVPSSIYADDSDLWYAGPSRHDVLWPKYLAQIQKGNFPEKAVMDLDKSSTKIVSLLARPSKEKIATRGLVVGYVQSGKTANFMAVMAKAADAGYRFVIVLSGVTNILRKQTQGRIQDDLISGNDKRWMLLTTMQKDFAKQGNANSILSDSSKFVLAVVKKHPSVLSNLTAWISAASEETLADCPILVIDDEADQASPNGSSSDEERSKINGLLIKLLSSFPKIAYVGYTATPFANVLIDPSSSIDLYPRDFIVSLECGDGYFGARELFGLGDRAGGQARSISETGMNVIRNVSEDEAQSLSLASGQKKENFTAIISPTMKTAILYFLMAAAGRIVRNQKHKHSTMLIHTSHITDIHHKFGEILKDFRIEIENKLAQGDKELVSLLKAIWRKEQKSFPSKKVNLKKIPFRLVKKHLHDIIDRCEVKVENSSSHSDDRINYDDDEVDASLILPDDSDPKKDGKIFIAIGGNVLARGLTLEGLLTTFFTRSASTYDTLLQMARWFGYRPGYADLPRIWMTETIRDYYTDLATVEEEIRGDIARYDGGEISPLQFAVRIRTHPFLEITSRFKMRAAKDVNLSYNGREVQTIVFPNTDEAWLEKNISATKSLLTSIRSEGIMPIKLKNKADRVYSGVPSPLILKFLSTYKIHKANSEMNSLQLRSYIENQNKKNSLKKFSVVVASLKKYVGEGIDLGTGENMPLVRRTKTDRDRGLGLVDIKALMAGGDTLLDVSEDDKKIGIEALLSKREDEGKDPINPSRLTKIQSRDVRDATKKGIGMIILYPIDRNSTPDAREIKENFSNGSNRLPLEAVAHIIGLALVFPDIDNSEIAQVYKSIEHLFLEQSGSDEHATYSLQTEVVQDD